MKPYSDDSETHHPFNSQNRSEFFPRAPDCTNWNIPSRCHKRQMRHQNLRNIFPSNDNQFQFIYTNSKSFRTSSTASDPKKKFLLTLLERLDDLINSSSSDRSERHRRPLLPLIRTCIALRSALPPESSERSIVPNQDYKSDYNLTLAADTELTPSAAESPPCRPLRWTWATL